MQVGVEGAAAAAGRAAAKAAVPRLRQARYARVWEREARRAAAPTFPLLRAARVRRQREPRLPRPSLPGREAAAAHGGVLLPRPAWPLARRHPPDLHQMPPLLLHPPPLVLMQARWQQLPVMLHLAVGVGPGAGAAGAGAAAGVDSPRRLAALPLHLQALPLQAMGQAGGLHPVPGLRLPPHPPRLLVARKRKEKLLVGGSWDPKLTCS